MTTIDWHEFLQQYNHRILAAEDEFDGQTGETGQDEWLGYPGASEEQLVQAEARLGVQLPPSYRAFLRASNGWRRTRDIGLALWSTDEIEWYSVQHQDDIDAWVEAVDAYEPDLPRVTDSEYFVYGSDQDPTSMRDDYLPTTLQISAPGDGDVYLLNPRVVMPNGDWEAWYYSVHAPGAYRYRSFAEMMGHELTGETVASSEQEHQAHGVEILTRPWPNRSVEEYIAALSADDSRAIEPLLQTLATNNSLAVRGTAARALVKFDELRAIEPLLSALLSDPQRGEQAVRDDLLPAFARLSTRLREKREPVASTTIPYLVNAVVNGDRYLRADAADLLRYANGRDSGLVALLKTAFRDEEALERQFLDSLKDG